MKRYIIYKITNNINGRYYIGRHATENLDDGYYGSGIGIKNSIAKYGKDNFTKEIIAESLSADLLWQLEGQIVNNEVVSDPKSYNMVAGGSNYINSLKSTCPKSFKEHQKKAGIKGAKAASKIRTKDWHTKGQKVSRQNIAKAFSYTLIDPLGNECKLDGTNLKEKCKELGVSYATIVDSHKHNRPITRGKAKGYRLYQTNKYTKQ